MWSDYGQDGASLERAPIRLILRARSFAPAVFSETRIRKTPQRHPAGSGLTEPEAVKAELRDYRASLDTVGMFLGECCEVGVKGTTMTRHLYEGYEIWCCESGLDALSQSAFGKCLGKKGLEPHKTAKGNGWRGVVLKDKGVEYCGFGKTKEGFALLN